MKHAQSLEEERKALLDQIHMSRDNYRRMLHQTEMEHAEAAAERYADSHSDRFPRSATMRWVMDHPYVIAAGVAGLVLMAPRGVRRRIGAVAVPALGTMAPALGSMAPMLRSVLPARVAASPSKTAAAGTAAATGMATLASVVTMLLRDPARMRLAARAFTTAMGYMRKRRQNAM
jgi:hypothetical protein